MEMTICKVTDKENDSLYNVTWLKTCMLTVFHLWNHCLAVLERDTRGCWTKTKWVVSHNLDGFVSSACWKKTIILFFFPSMAYIYPRWDTLSAVSAASLFHWVSLRGRRGSRRRRRRRRRRERLSYGGACKDGRLYNGGLIFHKVASHHQEREISEIKNEISSAHGQKKPCRLWTFSVLSLPHPALPLQI